MNAVKILWSIRAVLYRFKFGSMGLPSYIGRPTYVSSCKKIIFGKRCRIYPGLRAELVGDVARITVGDNVSIGQNFHVVSYNDNLDIGNNVTISGNVLITNCDHDYKKIGIHILEQELIPQKTEIGEGCFIGYGAVLQAGTILGKQCIVGANSVVRGKFPDYSVIVGAPAHIVKQYNAEKGEWIKE